MTTERDTSSAEELEARYQDLVALRRAAVARRVARGTPAYGGALEREQTLIARIRRWAGVGPR